MSVSGIGSATQRILLVDDDLQSLDSTRRILEMEGYQVQTAENGSVGVRKIKTAIEEGLPFALCVSDVRMPQMGGIEFLRVVSRDFPQLPVLLMTAFGTVEDAVEAMKLGAVDFLSKPFKRQTLLTALTQLQEKSRLTLGKGALKDLVPADWVGRSERFLKLQIEVEQVAAVASPVLVRGESGTGKEKVARLVHEKSTRAKGPWIALNCAALPENLIESELFGYEKGAFTGAQQSHLGLFEAAHGGTLFLDEIGDMPLPLQSRLLRVLQEGEVRPLGATQSKKVDVRVIAATHRDLHAEVQRGQFRQDLLFRLEVLTLDVPALRARGDDIILLANHFLQSLSVRHERANLSLSAAFRTALMNHTWPGNVRELQNVIERAVVFATDGQELDVEHLPPHLVSDRSGTVEELPSAGSSEDPDWIPVKIGTPLREVEDLLIRKTLEAMDGDKTATAQALGINARTIYRKLEKWEESEAPPPHSSS
jgi:two-component system response regulator HydG